MENQEILQLCRIESITSQRVFKDRRPTIAVATYHDSEGAEYRKSFLCCGNPVVPMSGTHQELNALKIQC